MRLGFLLIPYPQSQAAIHIPSDQACQRLHKVLIHGCFPYFFGTKNSASGLYRAFSCNSSDARRETTNYSIDEKDIGFFPKANCSGCPNHKPERHPGSRPFIALIMEVGGQTSILENAVLKTKTSVPKTNPAATQNIASKKPARSHAALPTTPTKGFSQTVINTPAHPRYSIFAYGCSPTVYRGILEEQRAGFTLLLRSRDFLGEHARGMRLLSPLSEK